MIYEKKKGFRWWVAWANKRIAGFQKKDPYRTDIIAVTWLWILLDVFELKIPSGSKAMNTTRDRSGLNKYNFACFPEIFWLENFAWLVVTPEANPF